MRGATDQWQKWLPIVQLCLNLKILGRTGSKPFDLFFGRPFNSFGDFSAANEMDNLEDAMDNRLEDLKELRDVVWPAVAEKTRTTRKKRAEWMDEHNKQLPSLQPGTKVMALDQTRSSKWDPIYEGPYTIIKQTAGGAYELQDHDGKRLDRKMVISMLKVIDGVPPSGGRKEIQKEDQHYEVLGILAHREKGKSKGNEYKVRWKGCGEEEDTWEPEENFDDMAVIKRYWKQRREGSIVLPRAKGRPKKKST
jgi:hypothetical protein